MERTCCRPVAISEIFFASGSDQTRTTPSPPAVARVWPSGDMANARHSRASAQEGPNALTVQVEFAQGPVRGCRCRMFKPFVPEELLGTNEVIAAPQDTSFVNAHRAQLISEPFCGEVGEATSGFGVTFGHKLFVLLATGKNRQRHHHSNNQGRCDEHIAIAHRLLRQQIQHRITAHFDHLTRKSVPKIPCQIGSGLVSLLRVLFHGLGDDRFDVAAQLASNRSQTRRLRVDDPSRGFSQRAVTGLDRRTIGQQLV